MKTIKQKSFLIIAIIIFAIVGYFYYRNRYMVRLWKDSLGTVWLIDVNNIRHSLNQGAVEYYGSSKVTSHPDSEIYAFQIGPEILK